MRFGTHSHDFEPEKGDSTVAAERARLVRSLRDLAERIERAKLTRARESLASIAAAVEPLKRTVERALAAAVPGRGEQ